MLSRKIERLKEELYYLERNTLRFLKEIDLSPDTRRTAERSVYLVAEIALDIADMAASVRGLPKAASYSDSIRKLGDRGIVPIRFAKKFVYIAGLRNFLAHDYEVDTTDDLKRFLKSGLADVRKFIDYIEEER